MGVSLDPGPATAFRETGGPTTLTLGAVGDTLFFKRSGTSVIGGSAGGGGVSYTVIRKSANFNATDSSGSVYVVDNTVASRTGSLPAAAGNDKVVLGFQKSDATGNTLTIAPNGTDKINGVNASIVLTVQGDYLELVCDAAGNDWIIK